ncbi:osiris 11 [Sergentomyia squamirostris]
MVSLKFIGGFVCLFAIVAAQDSSGTQGSVFRSLRKVYTQCQDSSDIVRCLKVQAVKLTDRALKLPSIKVVDGLAVVEKADKVQETSRSFDATESNVGSLPGHKLDEILAQKTREFMESRELKVNVPRLLAFGQTEGARLVEEGRKKMKKYYGPFMGAMAIKAGILTMAYHSIAIVAGKALIIGKIALIISAIIGLKKLVTPEGHEKTTYEIVKHPHISQSHSYSSSHGEFEGHESGGGQYHRSLGSGDLMMQDRAYRAHVPRV